MIEEVFSCPSGDRMQRTSRDWPSRMDPRMVSSWAPVKLDRPTAVVRSRLTRQRKCSGRAGIELRDRLLRRRRRAAGKEPRQRLKPAQPRRPLLSVASFGHHPGTAPPRWSFMTFGQELPHSPVHQPVTSGHEPVVLESPRSCRGCAGAARLQTRTCFPSSGKKNGHSNAAGFSLRPSQGGRGIPMTRS